MPDTARPDPLSLKARTGSPSPRLDEAEFKRRFLNQFGDEAYQPLTDELDRIAEAAWQAYSAQRKSPKTAKAGAGFADPDYDLSIDWRAASEAIRIAQRQHEDPKAPHRILLINGAARSEHTCPGEMSKSFRMMELAHDTLRHHSGVEIDTLDLSRTVSEYGRQIHPCKTCFSTSAALCHWPCSCYPNYSLGQTHDWMNDIYPLWTRAHGIMIITPVNWYQVSSPVKLMMDRLVCADGGNIDPTSTHGKKVEEAKALEMAGWRYQRHLAGRVFSVIVHGDSEGAENVRRSLADWLRSMELVSAGPTAELDRYVGYWEPYATSHASLDADRAMQQEVRNAAEALLEAVIAKREGKMIEAGRGIRQPREK